jgi:hypothetical protein
MDDVLVAEDVSDSHLESSVKEKRSSARFWQRMTPTSKVEAMSILYRDKVRILFSIEISLSTTSWAAQVNVCSTYI